MIGELLRAIRKSITIKVALDKFGRIACSDQLQAERHKTEDQRRARREVSSTRTDTTQTIRAAASKLNAAAAHTDRMREDLAKLSKALAVAAKIRAIAQGVVQIL